MFDIGFWELSLISIVALLVIGPERLPAVARTVGKWAGRANRFISNIKDDISKELKDEDLKRILSEQQKLADEYKNAANSMKSSFDSGAESLRESTHMDDLLEIDEPESSTHQKWQKNSSEQQSSSGSNKSKNPNPESKTSENTISNNKAPDDIRPENDSTSNSKTNKEKS